MLKQLRIFEVQNPPKNASCTSKNRARFKILFKQTENIATIVEANFIARDLINEPLSYLTAVQLAKEIQQLGKKAGFKVEVFDKKKITALKMGGLLSVNKGSQLPPTFTTMEWKPANKKQATYSACRQRSSI